MRVYEQERESGPMVSPDDSQAALAALQQENTGYSFDGEVLRPARVVVTDELHTVVGACMAEGAMDAGNMLKPMLARGELRIVGATTLDEYRKHIEKDATLERRFQPVLVDQPSVEDTMRRGRS